MSAQKLHSVVLTWEGEDLSAKVSCPWAPDDPERPCRLFSDWESEDPREPIDGCGVIDHLDAGGYESVDIREPLVSAPILVKMEWDAGYPHLSPRAPS